MRDRRIPVITIAVLLAVAAGAFFVLDSTRGKKVEEISFDVGKNIIETARQAGVPQFETRNVAGLISYSIAGFPTQIPVRYARQGYEVVWQPVFAFTLYADSTRNAAMPVQTAVLQLKNHLTSHEAAQAFVEQTLAQFAKGKWQRYADPHWDVLLTGRSSLLDESGKIADILMSIDPAYRISKTDWPVVVSRGPVWRWVGDGVLAGLTVNNFPGADGTPAYQMTLDFELLDVKRQRDAENLRRDLEKGDAKGWNSTAKLEADKREVRARNERLADNAVKRGDAVVTPQ